MKKFKDFQYQRPNMEALKQEFSELLLDFNNVESLDKKINDLERINKLRSEFDTMANIASIKYSLDTTNPEFEAEQDFFDHNSPIFQDYMHDFYQSLVQSKLRKELEAQFGKQLFLIAEMSLKTFNSGIIPNLQKENELATEYTKLISSAKINFEGNEHNLQSLDAYATNPNRELRKLASEAKWAFFEQHTQEFDQIFDDLVKVRHEIALKLGYKNFVELGYNRMLRSDYDAQMVANFRKQVLEEIVPLVLKLREKQSKRIGVEDLTYYDLKFQFLNGNPRPKGTPDWIVENGKIMYEELSTETGEFFNFMLDSDLLDLVTRKGKAPGGYCTYISDYQAPFIFSNFNGTSDDINVLTHEAGHAFQVYMSRDFDVPEYHWPTYEACEIHSMSMELLTWPWMNRFFGEDTEKYKFEHLSDSLFFLPYGVAVDDFQHFVYENPNASPNERKQAWSKIEKKYMPYLNYEGNNFLQNGGFWQKQLHIYQMPFYYIDYTLAQICAFQFWKKSNENPQDALKDYIRLCKAGGSQSFLQLVDYANLISPFKDGCLKAVVDPISQYLESIDESILV